MDCIAVNQEFFTLKSKLKAMWMAGDYDVFCRPMQPSGERFLRRVGVRRGASVLDVACGSGQISLAAAAAGADVTGLDLADNLIQKARQNAESMSLSIRFDQGDAESLPYEDESFDYVISAIGAMFAPAPDRVAAEMVRVCKPGGTIAMANWTASGFVGKMFRIISSYITPSGMPSPLLWGEEGVVSRRFLGCLDQLRFSRQFYVFDYPFPPSGVVEFFRLYYGPTACAFAALEPEQQEKLRAELEELWTRHNEAADGTTSVHAEYLEVNAIRGARKNSRREQ